MKENSLFNVTNTIFYKNRLDARGRSLQQAVHWADQDVFSSKPHFYYDTHPPALRVRSIEQKDAGIYRCRVDFQHSPTRNWRIHLSVSGNFNQFFVKSLF